MSHHVEPAEALLEVMNDIEGQRLLESCMDVTSIAAVIGGAALTCISMDAYDLMLSAPQQRLALAAGIGLEVAAGVCQASKWLGRLTKQAIDRFA